MNKPLKLLPTRVWRTYRGGRLLEEFLGYNAPLDSDFPEDWIASFLEAKNPYYIEKEGISKTEEGYITDIITPEDFGEGRREPELLTKLLDSSERLGIQVHPTDEFSQIHFGTPFGKTECWHILNKRSEDAAIYLGFKENVTKEKWRELFLKQDINGMLDCLHKFEPMRGDTILVRGGMPHAIGAGLFLLEIQQPCDYTMRAETMTAYGAPLSDMQIHYGLGIEKMLDCFSYSGKSREETFNECFLKHDSKALEDSEETPLVTYSDTPFFALKRVKAKEYSLKEESFLSLIITEGRGEIEAAGEQIPAKKGDKFFIPARCLIKLKNLEALICYPPRKEKKK